MSQIRHLRTRLGISERDLASRADVSRQTLRTYEGNLEGAKIETLRRIAQELDHEVLVAILPAQALQSDLTTVAVSCDVVRDGFESWKIHFMNFVDAFRRTPNLAQILLPPISSLDQRLAALLAAMVCRLCSEVGLSAPRWAMTENFLERPWFVAGMESLKATAIAESPPEFRRNNIFVHENFLLRA